MTKVLHSNFVLGGSKRVDMSLKNEMPFTCAFIQEIWRVCSPAPFGAPHKAQSDTEVLGYCIPKGYSVILYFV